VRVRPVPHARVDVEDPPAAPRQHAGDDRPDRQVRALQVRLDDLPPLVGVGGRTTQVAPPAAVPAVPAPSFAAALPADTTQVGRTVRTNQWCRKVYCTKTEAWEKVDGAWRIVTLASGRQAVFRSTIGPNGFAPPGQRREDDGRAPSGVFSIVTTFSTGTVAPGAMPWRPRLKTSIVSNKHNRFYNTWIEHPKVSNGARPSMRYGFWLDYNNPRLTPGVGPAPVVGVGSGIFYHTARPGQEWIPTFGCTQIGNAQAMAWVVRWLHPDANPRVVNNI
jgi:L,D-peptidoglycan transpeptidase YkuD (ErfK/YbiS/YcfS/YnhG family)